MIFFENTLQASNNSIEQEIFEKSPKFLVHIGFPKGLPEDGLMKPSDYDPCLYFALNGPFSKTKLMPKLDKHTNVIILPLTEKILKRCVSFHPTEVLLIGELNLIEENATIVCYKNKKVPNIFLEQEIITYENKNIEARNMAVTDYIKEMKGFPSCIVLDEHDSWGNCSQVITNINAKEFNINDITFYKNEIQEGMVYSCPAGCFNEYSSLYKIGFLSELKHFIKLEKSKEEIKNKSEKLIEWVKSLDYIDFKLKEEFKLQVSKMTGNNSGCVLF